MKGIWWFAERIWQQNHEIRTYWFKWCLKNHPTFGFFDFWNFYYKKINKFFNEACFQNGANLEKLHQPLCKYSKIQYHKFFKSTANSK